MKKVFVDEFSVGREIDSIFLVRDKKLKKTQHDKPFLDLNLIDKTGKVNAKLWEKRDDQSYVERVYESFGKNDFVRVTGRVESYRESNQLNVDTIELVDDEDVELSDFQPTGERNPDEMVKEFVKINDGIKNPHIKKLIASFFKDNGFMSKFKTAPAAKKLHQAYLGGLMEHTLNLVNIAIALADYYPFVNRDLLICGALFHDIGKMEELDYVRSFDYSDTGRLLGHIFIGAEMVKEKIDKIDDFPKTLSDMILHMILSHHGELQFGSPVLPAIPEAIILHQIDNMDAKVWGFLGEMERSIDVDGNWTKYSNVYNRFIYKGDTSFGIESDDDSNRKDTRKKKRSALSLFDDE